MGESKIRHEVDQYLTVFNESGAVEKPWSSAIQRHQNHQNPLGIDPFHDTFLISSQTRFRK